MAAAAPANPSPSWLGHCWPEAVQLPDGRQFRPAAVDAVTDVITVLQTTAAQWPAWRDACLALVRAQRHGDAVALLESGAESLGAPARRLLTFLHIAGNSAVDARDADHVADEYALRRVAAGDAWSTAFLRLFLGDARGARPLFEEHARALTDRSTPALAMLARVGLALSILADEDSASGGGIVDAAHRAAGLLADALRQYGDDAPLPWWRWYAYALAAAQQWQRAGRVFGYVLRAECTGVGAADDARRQPSVNTLLGAWAVARALERRTPEAADSLSAELLREAYVLYGEDRRVRNALATARPAHSGAVLDEAAAPMRRGNTRQARARSDALRARWHHQRGDVTTAETLYGTCLQHGVESAVARYALARLLLARGEYAQAADEWARVMPQLELATSGALRDGNRDEAAGLEATALWGVALAMASRAPDITETARDTLGQQAVQVLNRVPLAALPDDACICLAQLVELREPQRGCDLYRAVLARRPDDALLWNNVAALSARDGALSAAMDAMREAVRAVVPEMPPSDAVAVVSALLREPEHVTMAYNYARLWEMDGALSAAERLFEAIHRTYSAYVDAALRLGVLAERYRRDLAAAERYFRAAVPHPQAVFALAFLFQAQGRVEDAQQWFEYFVHHRDEWKKVTSSSSGGAVRSYCDVVMASYYIVMARSVSRHHHPRRCDKFLAAAGHILASVLQRSPGNVAAMNLLGVFFQERNLLQEAEECYAAVVQQGAAPGIEPSVVACARANLVAVHVLRGATMPAGLRAAVRLAEEQIASGGADAESMVMLAVALGEMGRHDESARVWQRALQRQPAAWTLWFNWALALALQADKMMERGDNATELEHGLALLERARETFAAVEVAVAAASVMSAAEAKAWQRCAAGATHRLVDADAARRNAHWCQRRHAEGVEARALAQRAAQAAREERRLQQQLREQEAQRQALAAQARAEAQRREEEELERMALEQQRELARRQQEWNAQRRGRRQPDVLVEVDASLTLDDQQGDRAAKRDGGRGRRAHTQATAVPKRRKRQRKSAEQEWRTEHGLSDVGEQEEEEQETHEGEAEEVVGREATEVQSSRDVLGEDIEAADVTPARPRRVVVDEEEEG
ncbi:hypothetical protein CDCA_CDCA02G0796 [Cyanidium caldarium]|uniref:Uncharacterized protein n=1 Tax=Cyanidium caldarium TaxID=2771 RepID=A0AAV9IRE8_CYACA|nr:hypothetical protein CDCA_CDCA02G0796 [Cyanidium caldarium]